MLSVFGLLPWYHATVFCRRCQEQTLRWFITQNSTDSTSSKAAQEVLLFLRCLRLRRLQSCLHWYQARILTGVPSVSLATRPHAAGCLLLEESVPLLFFGASTAYFGTLPCISKSANVHLLSGSGSLFWKTPTTRLHQSNQSWLITQARVVL